MKLRGTEQEGTGRSHATGRLYEMIKAAWWLCLAGSTWDLWGNGLVDTGSKYLEPARIRIGWLT